MNWYLPDIDPYIQYAWRELIRWVCNNTSTFGYFVAFVAWLKIKAIRTENVIDDKIVSLLGYGCKLVWSKVRGN